MKKSGILILAVGIFFLIVTLGVDTSVSTPSGRVNNIGLMNEKLIYSLVCIAVAIAGLILWVFSDKREKLSTTLYGDERVFSPPKSDEQCDENRQEREDPYKGERSVSIPNYQLFLTKRFSIEKNTTLEKYVIDEDVFDTLEMALQDADRRYGDQLDEQRERARIEAELLEEERVLREEQDARRDSEKVRQDEIDARLASISRRKWIRLAAVFSPILLIILGVIVVARYQAQKTRLENEQRLSNTVSAMVEMFSTGSFFGNQIGTSGSSDLSRQLGIPVVHKSADRYELVCRDQQCNPVFGTTNLSQIKTITWIYCEQHPLDEAYKAQSDPKSLLLTGVSIFFENPSLNERMNTMLHGSSMSRWDSTVAIREVTSDALGVGLLWRAPNNGSANICSRNN